MIPSFWKKSGSRLADSRCGLGCNLLLSRLLRCGHLSGLDRCGCLRFLAGRLLGCGGANAASASVRTSISFARGLLPCLRSFGAMQTFHRSSSSRTRKIRTPSYDSLRPGGHAKVGRTKVVLSQMPPVLRELWGARIPTAMS
jgi:hypothetical protein